MTNPITVIEQHVPEITLTACRLAGHTNDANHQCFARQCKADDTVVDGFYSYQIHLISVLARAIT